MEEIEAMKTIADSLKNLDEGARIRVLSWAGSKFGGAVVDSKVTTPPTSKVSKTSSNMKKASSKSSKTKSVISMDKTLDLSPSGKKSAIEFQSEKAPASVVEKCVVAAYYLREIIEVDAITVTGVFTFFKAVGWKVPSDIRNTLQQAGSKGWLDTKDGDDIKITSMGENLIEHDLPKSKK